MAKPKFVNKAPVRCKQKRPRLWLFDFRGIQKNAPSKNQLKLLKKVNRSYRGEKPVFTSPEQLQTEIDQYFDSCYGPIWDKRSNDWLRDADGNLVKQQVQPFTVNGLAYYIGVPTETLDQISWGFKDDWGETDEEKIYSAILKRAKQRIALYSEGRLYDRDGVVGAKFVLNHYFRMLERRDEAEINAIKKNLEYKQQELEMKKQMLDIDDEDGLLQITIVRKED